ncbi:MAG: hypothetical protein CMJ80_10685 [Planctomycetaceae bacterium]|nr:hypothetical protein [Planctomycetaceae bacterium]
MSAVVNAGRTVHDSMAAWLLRRVSDVTLWMLTLTAIWLIWRRSAGGFARPLSEPWLIGLALVLTAPTLVVFVPDSGRRALTNRWLAVVWIAAMVANAAAVSVPGSPVRGIILLWTLVGAASVWAIQLGRRDRASWPGRRRLRLRMNDYVDHTADHLPSGVDQQEFRGRDPSGEMFVGGRVRHIVPAGQKLTHLHFAFCPHLDAVPAMSVEVVEGPPASVKVGMLVHQGVRFDVRLNDSLPEPAEIIVAFFGHYQSQEYSAYSSTGD